MEKTSRGLVGGVLWFAGAALGIVLRLYWLLLCAAGAVFFVLVILAFLTLFQPHWRSG